MHVCSVSFVSEAREYSLYSDIIFFFFGRTWWMINWDGNWAKICLITKKYHLIQSAVEIHCTRAPDKCEKWKNFRFLFFVFIAPLIFREHSTVFSNADWNVARALSNSKPSFQSTHVYDFIQIEKKPISDKEWRIWCESMSMRDDWWIWMSLHKKLPAWTFINLWSICLTGTPSIFQWRVSSQ